MEDIINMTDPLKDPKVLIPMIRKLMPTVLAQQITGVQPMTGIQWPTIKRPKFEVVDKAIVDGVQWYTILIYDQEIWFWITQQDGPPWSHRAEPATNRTLADISEEMYALLLLKWS
jgi:hypothetical protein